MRYLGEKEFELIQNLETEIRKQIQKEILDFENLRSILKKLDAARELERCQPEPKR